MKSFSKLVDQHGEDLLAKNVPVDKVNIKPDPAPEEHVLHMVDEPQAAPRQEARSDALTLKEIWKKKSRSGAKNEVNIKPDPAPETHLLRTLDEPQVAPRQEARSD